MKTTSLKDWRKVYRRLGVVRGLNKSGKILFAKCLAATPDERWQMNVERCKALGVWGKGLAGKRRLERLVISGNVV